MKEQGFQPERHSEDYCGINTTRLMYWNYGSTASYFITCCTIDRKPLFGEVKNGEVIHSEIGNIAQIEWFKTAELRKDMNVHLGEFIVMPDHIHGIIFIGENPYNTLTEDGGNFRNLDLGTSVMHDGSTDGSYAGSVDELKPFNKFGPQSKNLASIIRGYKSAVTTYARKNQIPFNWQPGFIEKRIKSQRAFSNYAAYIRRNPEKWELKYNRKGFL